MDSLDTPIAEMLRLLLNRKWRELYDFHQIHRLSPIELFQALERLTSLGIVQIDGSRVRLMPTLDECQASLINKLMKTRRPAKLMQFTRGRP